MNTANAQKGFTLIEMMVSLTLFVIVVLAVIGSLYSVNNASKKAASMRQVLDNVNFAVDEISRTIRTATNIVCNPSGKASDMVPGDHDCAIRTGAVGDVIQMVDTQNAGAIVEFFYDADGGRIMKNTKAAGETYDPSNAITLTSPSVSIKRLYFFVDGVSVGDTTQPSVSIFVKGTVKAIDGEVVPFSVQTSVSQRAII